MYKYCFIQFCKLSILASIVLMQGLNLQAQSILGDISIEAGATLMDWDGLLDKPPGSYNQEWGYFAGLTTNLLLGKSKNKSLDVSIKYRNTETNRTTNFERIILTDVALSAGPVISWKRLKFNLNGTFVYLLSKTKLDNTPLTGVDLEDVEKYYLTASGKIFMKTSSKTYIFVEQAILSTKVHHTYLFRRGTRSEKRRYPGWTLLGIGYQFSN